MKKAQVQEIKDVDDSFLPKKALFRVDEAASYFNVSNSCIYTWIAHGHLQAEKIVGVVRVTRASILNCRFNYLRSRAMF